MAGLSRRRLLESTACTMLMAAAGHAFAQAEDPAAYPSRTVRLIVPAAPGGPIDAVARIMGDALKAAWPVPVVVENRGTQVSGGTTDFDGKYDIKPIDPGTYDVVVSYVGYQPYKQTGVVVNSNKITFLDIALNAGIELKEFEVVEYQVPLISKDGGASGGTVPTFS